jgi:hypothetical protein
LANEIYVWVTKKELFNQLQSLNADLARVYKDMDIGSKKKPDVENTQTAIKNIAYEMEQAYGVLGSLFRNGSRQTFFSSQVMRYADLYSHSALNLMYYPLCYMFRAPAMLMPHESTVPHGDDIDDLPFNSTFYRGPENGSVEGSVDSKPPPSKDKAKAESVMNTSFDSDGPTTDSNDNRVMDCEPVEYDQNGDAMTAPHD